MLFAGKDVHQRGGWQRCIKEFLVSQSQNADSRIEANYHQFAVIINTNKLFAINLLFFVPVSSAEIYKYDVVMAVASRV